jgi:hypothetical protein
MKPVGRTPLGVPSGPRDALVPLFAEESGKPARGPIADQGVRPTSYAEFWHPAQHD